MKKKISDFPLTEWYLRRICAHLQTPFVDLPVTFFAEENGGWFSDGKIVVGYTNSLSQTLFQIFAAYLQNIEKISGPVKMSDQEKIQYINTFVAIGRDLTYGSGMSQMNKITEAVTTRLNRDTFIWMLLRDVVCPVFDVPIKNVRILASSSPYVDGAKYFEQGDIDAPTLEPSDFPFIYLNLNIENIPCRSAYLFHEAIKAQGMNPKIVIHDVLSKAELRSKVEGLTKAAFVDDDMVDNFIFLLGILVGYERPDEIAIPEKTAKSNGRVTQAQFANGSWWLMGLIENALEPSRGFNWQSYQELEPMTNELWEKVEKEKKRRGLKELPMELLLRVQSEECQQQPDLIIQGLLADNRIW